MYKDLFWKFERLAKIIKKIFWFTPAKYKYGLAIYIENVAFYFQTESYYKMQNHYCSLSSEFQWRVCCINFEIVIVFWIYQFGEANDSFEVFLNLSFTRLSKLLKPYPNGFCQVRAFNCNLKFYISITFFLSWQNQETPLAPHLPIWRFFFPQRHLDLATLGVRGTK